MGSGVFLAAVVVAWFLVLVPMVLTRRDTAFERALAEDDVSGSRVLSRTAARAAAHSRRRVHMSARESSPSLEPAADQEYDGTVDTAVHERIIEADASHDDAGYDDASHDDAGHEAAEVDEARPRRGNRRTDEARQQIVARRRTTLLGIGAAFVLMLALALFAGSWTWFLAVGAGLALGAYVAHLRAETRREDERRLTREIRANRPRQRSDRPARSRQSQSSLASNAFVGGQVAATGPEVVSLDDEDLAFYDLADAPVADQVDLSGHDYYAEYTSSEYQNDMYDFDDDAEAYGLEGRGETDGNGVDMPHAV